MTSPVWLAALELTQEHGWPVFPVEARGKRPLVDGGFHAASTHPEQIGAWADRWPNANLGFCPGSRGMIVLDVDGPNGETAARTAGAFDVPTLEVVTRRGVHRYFRLPAGVTIGNVARTELDVRAHNGYVLLPPSIHESGHVYAWRGELDTIADLPAGVLAELTRPTPATKPTRSSRPVPTYSGPVGTLDRFTERRVLAYTDCVGYGLSDGRKTAAYRLACFYQYDVGLTPDLAWACLSRWNAVNSPALPEHVLAEIHGNAGRYARGAGAA